MRRLAANLALSAAGLFASCAQAEPPATQLGYAYVDGDWAYGCDNLAQCRATSLGGKVEGEFADGLRLSIDITAASDLQFALLSVLPSPADDIGGEEAAVHPRDVASFRLDGKDISFTVVPEKYGPDIPRRRFAVPVEFLHSIALGSEVELLDRAGQMIGTISANGFASALQQIDTLRGFKPVVPTPIAFELPPPSGWARVGHLPPDQVQAWQRQANCPEADEAPENRPLASTAAPINAVHDLILIACAATGPGDGDGPAFFLPLVRSLIDGSVTLARFDKIPSYKFLPDVPLLPDPRVSDGNGILHTTGIGRPLGDCGDAREYVWDGSREEFVLIRAYTMPSCRTAGEWIRTYFRETKIWQVDFAPEP